MLRLEERLALPADEDGATAGVESARGWGVWRGEVHVTTLAKLYKKSTKEIAFVRTGFGGEKVILNGGALVLPIFQDVIPVNMNTLRLEVGRRDSEALIRSLTTTICRNDATDA